MDTPVDLDVPAVVVSCDSHAGPRLVEDLRQYCPKQHLDSFDEMVGVHREQREERLRQASLGDNPALVRALGHPNLGRPGHYDAGARLADMDYDGIAAEVIYHFSQNGEPMPWIGVGGFDSVRPEQFDIAEVAFAIYNRWLADFCAADPQRLVGLAYMPTWNIEACVRELEWARGAGLRAVNFPSPGKPGHLEYNNLAWEPFWSACADLGFTLHTHASPASHIDYFSGPGGYQIWEQEQSGWMTRRAIWWLIFGQVFERHPALKLVETEQQTGWLVPTAHEMDSMYLTFKACDLPRLPSEYMRDHVFYGASFPSRAGMETAAEDGWANNVIWGRDYPHMEGTYQAVEDPSVEPITRQSLRHIFCNVPLDDALRMLGQNGVRVLDLDGEYLAGVAQRINAITPRELQTPLDTVPEVDSIAFVGFPGPLPIEPYRVEWSRRHRGSTEPAPFP